MRQTGSCIFGVLVEERSNQSAQRDDQRLFDRSDPDQSCCNGTQSCSSRQNIVNPFSTLFQARSCSSVIMTGSSRHGPTKKKRCKLIKTTEKGFWFQRLWRRWRIRNVDFGLPRFSQEDCHARIFDLSFSLLIRVDHSWNRMKESKQTPETDRMINNKTH